MLMRKREDKMMRYMTVSTQENNLKNDRRCSVYHKQDNSYLFVQFDFQTTTNKATKRRNKAEETKKEMQNIGAIDINRFETRIAEIFDMLTRNDLELDWIIRELTGIGSIRTIVNYYKRFQVR